ncbi:9724_t:CDS:2 [Dentiscutata erythropus]|uniref:9724_t:CDS:1 n=1 Tax=Dentiscutata erythropus TaxID=1348616 RepID=A0A9N9E7M7_9GLOM|nr:9724_t:CDS:2 [Dentiscutata erythropus]
MIQNKAAALAKSPKYILHYPNINMFKWSNKWPDRFLQYNSFSNHCKTTIAQKLLAELETQQQAFLNFVQYCCIQYDYLLLLMGNMDKTLLSFDMPSNVTIDNKGNKIISIRTCSYEKSCFTVVLACMADGKKLLPMIIFKLKNDPRLEFSPGVVVRANKIRSKYNEWISQEIRELTESGRIKHDEYVFNGKNLVSQLNKTFYSKNTFILIRPQTTKPFASTKLFTSTKPPTPTKLPRPSITTIPLIPRTLSSARSLAPTKPFTSTRFLIKSTLFTPTKSSALAKLLISTTTRFLGSSKLSESGRI